MSDSQQLATKADSMTAKQLRLTALLRSIGVDLAPDRTKLVRHQDHRFDIAELLSLDQLDIYQSNQDKHIFKGCDNLLTFSADGGSRSELLGLYHVRGFENTARKWPANFLYPNAPLGSFWYNLEKDDALSDLEGRLVIDWGGATRAWHQWLAPDKDKLVIEIKARGRQMPFPGYDDVVLSFDDLQSIVANQAANLDWFHALSKVSGVYLIHDTQAGIHYVGSAYGVDGIWGRWSNYVQTQHGNNVQLRSLCEQNPGRHRMFRFSILNTLPLSEDAEKVIDCETTWKHKLGSRAFGLNGN
ncbi:MAG: GIY-YIG nuclease family protein [Planctomycetota bacterium]